MYPACFFLFLSFLGLASCQATGDRPPEVHLIDVTYGGSGCGSGSVSVKPSPDDASKLTLRFDRLIAQSGQNLSVFNYRRVCQVNLKLRYSAGWQFSVARAGYRGYALVPAGLTGVSKSTYYFSGNAAQMSSNLTISGPHDSSYLRVDQFDTAADATVWSPCGNEALFNIVSDVRLTPVGSNSTGLITIEAAESANLVWRTCTRTPPPPSSTTSATSLSPSLPAETSESPSP